MSYKLEWQNDWLKPNARNPTINVESSLDYKRYRLTFYAKEHYEIIRAMLEFCTEYEPESFELFYKWFKQNKGKED